MREEPTPPPAAAGPPSPQPMQSAPPSADGGPPAGDDAAAHGGHAPPAPDASNEAPDLTRAYRSADGRITVEWYAGRCIHSANCVRALPRVFDPRRKPWVEPDAADADAIAAAVRRCPTGALQYVRGDGAAPEAPDVPSTATAIRHGPLYLRGDLEVRAPDGTLLRRGTRVSVCRCARTQQQPFCDNTCRATGWREPDGVEGPERGAPSPDGAAA